VRPKGRTVARRPLAPCPAGLGEISEHLDACGVEIEVGPVQRAGARGAMTSVYCLDPDGSLIEIATYR
jgi:catechol 2,3-dioxygenase-like lactoylglutathione lyase family enzyme